MNDEKTVIAIDEAQPGTQLLGTEGSGEGIDARRACVSATGKVDRFIALIESRVLLRECLRRSMEPALSLPIIPYSTASELGGQLHDASPQLVVLSLAELDNAAVANILRLLSELVPGAPIIVLAQRNDADLVRTAIRHGVKGFIPSTSDFALAIEAIRFALAGGTYVQIDYPPTTDRSSLQTSQILSAPCVIAGEDHKHMQSV
jgi:DNA-binding NarL/FixJ family response regulator